jgi:ATP-binding cassette, subfamily B, bacterial
MKSSEVSSWLRIRKLYRVFGPYVTQRKREIALAYLALGGSVGAAALRPWPLKFILDSVVLRKRAIHESVPVIPAWVDAINPYWLIFIFCLLLVLVVLAESTAGYFQKLMFARIGHSAATGVLEHTFTHLHTLPREHRSSGSGDLIVRLTSDVKTMRDLLVEHQQKLSTYSLTFFVTVAVMLQLNWRLTLIGLSTVPVIWIVSWRFSRSIRAAARRKRTREGAVASVVHENLSGLAVIQAFAREEEEHRRFREQAQESLEANVESSRLGGAFSRVIEVLNTLGMALVIGFGAVKVLAGSLSPGDLVVFAAYVTDLYKPIQNLSELSIKFMDSLVSGERVLEVLEKTPQTRDHHGAVRAPRLKGDIVFDRVTFGYEAGKPVLHELSFRISPGENIALVGGSGAGKSTILHLLLRFYDPWQGRISIDGRDIRYYKTQSLRQQIGVVLQESFLFRRSLFENITYGKPGATPAQVRAAAEAARAHSFIQELPEGYETILDERGGNLSGGQRQRLALARVFLRNASILLMDEPTSSLDSVTEGELVETFQELRRGKTTITVAHRLSTVENASRILVLEHGSIIEAGTYDQLLAKPGAFRNLYEAQLEEMRRVS